MKSVLTTIVTGRTYKYHYYYYYLNSRSLQKERAANKHLTIALTSMNSLHTTQSKKKKPGGYKDYYNNCNNGHHVLSACLLYSRTSAKCFIYTISFDPPSSPKQWMLSVTISETQKLRLNLQKTVRKRPSWELGPVTLESLHQGLENHNPWLSPACCLSLSIKGDFSLIYRLWLLWGYHSRGEGLPQRSYDESLKRLLPGPLWEKSANAT